MFGDLVSGPWGSIPGPGEGRLRVFWTPETKTNIVIFIRAQRAPTIRSAVYCFWREPGRRTVVKVARAT